jgi:hypothetical protein
MSNTNGLEKFKSLVFLLLQPIEVDKEKYCLEYIVITRIKKKANLVNLNRVSP